MTSGNISIPAGVQLEARIQRLLFNQGYFAIRNVFLPGHYQARGASTPDIDVLGYNFSEDFVPTRVIYDCKSGRSAAVVNRVLWLQTLARHANANRVYMVRRDTQKDIKYYGLAEGVCFIDFATLDELEQNHVGSTIKGSTNTEYLAACYELRRPTRSPDIAHALTTVHTDFWFLPSISAVKQVISRYERISAISTLPGLSPRNLQWLKATLIALFVLGILRICSETIGLNQAEREEVLRQRLVSDKIPHGEFTSLVRTAFEYAYTIYGKPQGLPMGEHYQIPPPKYSDSLLDLITRALKHPKEAVVMPLFSECLLFEYILPEKTVDIHAIELIFGRSYDHLLSHYRDYIFFLSKICPSIKDFLRPLFPNQSTST
ncbi:hypothetical protein ES708_11103 [subsurface metagenome]